LEKNGIKMDGETIKLSKETLKRGCNNRKEINNEDIQYTD
jgi:hypothetical protein